MKIATYGPKVFSISADMINTFGAVSRSSSYNVEEQENGTNKAKLKNKAPGLETMAFELQLRNDFVNVRDEIESWLVLQGKSYYFIVGNEKYGTNKWELIGVDITNQEFTLRGVLKKATVSLNFKEMVSTVTNNVTAKQTRNTKR